MDLGTLPQMANGGAASRITAFLLLAAALALFFLTVWRLDPASTSQASVEPWPDAAEYLDGALHLANQGTFRIQVAAQQLPSRYPFGMSLLQAGLLKLGVEPLAAPYLLNKIAGLALLLSVFALVAGQGQFVAAGLAALLLSTRTSFIILSRSPMSEIVAMLIILWAVAALYRYAQGGPIWMGCAGTLLLGLTTSVRLSCVLLAGFPLAALLVRSQAKAAGLLKQGGLLAAAGLAGLAPVMIYHWAVFGAPWKTGYSFWLDRGGDPLNMFALRHLTANLDWLWQEMRQKETIATVAHHVGEGSLYSPSYALLCLLSLPVILSKPALRWFAVAGGLYGAAMLFYDFGFGRQYFPLLILSLPWTAYAWSLVFRRTLGDRRWSRASAALILLLVVLAGWPGARSDSDMGDMFRTHPLHLPCLAYSAAKQINALPAGGKLILTDMNPPYLHAATCCQNWTAPLQNEHDYRFNPQNLTFGTAQRQELIQQALQQGREVYAATTNLPIDDIAQTCAPPPGMGWKILWRNLIGGGVAQLKRKQEAGNRRQEE